jgi:hypothetical protein
MDNEGNELSPRGRSISEEVRRLAVIEMSSAVRGQPVTLSEWIVVQRHAVSSPQPNMPEEVGQAINQLDATQRLMYEQLKTFRDEHQSLRHATGTALEPQIRR